jgi:hypothetical protein
MPKGALFLRFGFPFPGYRAKSLKVFAEATEYWKGLQQRGVIDSFEPVFLDYHAADFAGFILVRGDRDKLAKLQMDPEFESRNQRAAMVLSGFGIVPAFTGDELQRRFADYGKQAAEWD